MQKIKLFENISNNSYLKKLSKQNLLLIRDLGITLSSCILLINIINSSASIYLLKQPKPFSSSGGQAYTPLVLSSGASYLQIRKKVLERNVFNLSGEIPLEDKNEDNGLIQNFDSVPCSQNNEKLPVELVGILYTGNPNTNLVTFKDPRIQTADVYKEGQTLIENESYEIYKIPNPSTVQVRLANTKICLSTGTESRSSNTNDKNIQSDGQSYEFTTDFVDEQIGPGFSKILNSARLVPEVLNGKTIGFKIFAITAGSLFDKMNLENGDIIKSVNGINLEDPSQGFKLYEALQDETNIIFQINRAGMQMTKKVIVR